MATAPSFSRPAARTPRRACSQASVLGTMNKMNERTVTYTTPLRIKVIHALYYSALVYHVSCIEHGNGHKNKQINKTKTHKTKKKPAERF